MLKLIKGNYYKKFCNFGAIIFQFYELKNDKIYLGGNFVIKIEEGKIVVVSIEEGDFITHYDFIRYEINEIIFEEVIKMIPSNNSIKTNYLRKQKIEKILCL